MGKICAGGGRLGRWGMRKSKVFFLSQVQNDV